MSLLSFQIRGETHPHGSLHITENAEGKILLDGEATEDFIEVGGGGDAFLLAKCLEVYARSKVSDEFEEVSRDQFRELLEQVKADHQLIDEPEPEP